MGELITRRGMTVLEALWLVLDQVDYISGKCRSNEMVGAVLTKEVLELAREAANAKPIRMRMRKNA